MAGPLWLLLGLIAICRAARPTEENDGASVKLTVKSSGHHLAEHRAGTTREGRNKNALHANGGPDPMMDDLPEAEDDNGYEGRESPALDAPAQQQMGIIPFFERSGGADAYRAAKEMGFHHESPVDRYLSANAAANSSAPWPGTHVYTPNFEKYVSKSLKGLAAPIMNHARDVVGRSAEAYNALQKAQQVGRKLGQAMRVVGEQTNGIHKQLKSETDEVKRMMTNGFEAYEEYVERKGKIKDGWKNVAQLSDAQLIDEGERLGKTSQDFNLWDQELGSSNAASMAPLLNKEDSWVYNRNLAGGTQDDDMVHREPQDDGMEWQADSIERRTGVEGNDLDVFPGDRVASMDGVAAPYGRGSMRSTGGTSSRGSSQHIEDDGGLGS